MSRRAVGVVGLGQMGGALAGALLRGGFPTFGFDIDDGRGALFAQAGGTVCASPRAVAEQCDVVLTSLASSAALEDVVRGGDGLVAARKAPSAVVETSTLPLESKQRARTVLADAGIVLLDCPVSGTAAQARRGDLVVFVSGNEARATALGDVFDALGRSWRYLGEFGVGTKMKFVANLLIAVHNMAAGEALVLGRKAGLDPQLVYEVIADSAATSRMFEVSGPLMIERRYDDASAKVQILHKDLQLIRTFATDVGAPTPLMAVTAEFYTAAMARGMATKEDASVCLLLEQLAGIDEAGAPSPDEGAR
jgi:L-threonate 2-dehydrogenase